MPSAEVPPTPTVDGDRASLVGRTVDGDRASLRRCRHRGDLHRRVRGTGRASSHRQVADHPRRPVRRHDRRHRRGCSASLGCRARPTPSLRSDAVKYSTTVGTNALIERTGPKVGLITTAGQEDTVHVARSRSWADGMPLEVQIDRTRAQRPDDLVPRKLRVGVRERIDCFGEVLMPLSTDDVLAAVDHSGAPGRSRAIAVCLAWSFMNPTHEQPGSPRSCDASTPTRCLDAAPCCCRRR